MPQAIPFIIQAVGSYLGASALVVAVAVVAASALVSNYQKRKAARSARDAFNASLEDRLVMTTTANQPRSFVYGRSRNVDGIVFKGTWGTHKENFTLVVAMAGHEIHGFEKIYFNDQPVNLIADGVAVTGGAEGGQGYYVDAPPFSQNPVITGRATMTVGGGGGAVVLPHTPVAGSVSVIITVNPGSETFDHAATPSVVGNTVTVGAQPYTGDYSVSYQYVDFVPKARLWMYRGAPGQTIYPLLSAKFPGLLTATDKFSGMAIIVADLTYDQDAYSSGPPSITAVMRGAKILDTRNGITDWSENPAMIARAWAMNPYGGGCTTEDINEASFIAAANACDTSTVFNTTAGNEVRPLYQCGIVCKTDVNPDDAFGEMVESMAGKWGFAGGQLKVVAGVYRAPVAAITDLWLNDKKSITVTKNASKQDLVNNFKPVISNADGYIDGVTGPTSSVAYTSTPMPNVRSVTFIAADGQELTRETVMLGVTRNVHAQHICAVQMRDMRDGMLVTLQANMRAWPLELFDVVTLTLPLFGFAAKQFEVLAWRYTLEEGVNLTLKETAASIYQVDGGLEVLDASQNTTLPLPWFVEQVTGVTVTSAQEDGWPTTRTLVTWNPVVSEAVRQSGSIEIQYTQATTTLPAGDWPAVYEQGNSTSTTIAGLLSNTAYVFRVRARNTLGVAGQWAVQNASIVEPPPLVDTPIIEDEAATVALSSESASGSSIDTDPLGVLVTQVSWTNTTADSVNVQAEWSANLTNAGPGAGLLSYQFINPSGVGASWFSSPAIANTVTAAKVIQRSVPAGGTATVAFRAYTTGTTVSWENAVVRLSAILR
jgi:hypothetical protein